ncbi:MAG: hypothetical protein ACLF0G_06190 [Candidatus Brocadiia bacterium]
MPEDAPRCRSCGEALEGRDVYEGICTSCREELVLGGKKPTEPKERKKTPQPQQAPSKSPPIAADVDLDADTKELETVEPAPQAQKALSHSEEQGRDSILPFTEAEQEDQGPAAPQQSPPDLGDELVISIDDGAAQPPPSAKGTERPASQGPPSDGDDELILTLDEQPPDEQEAPTDEQEEPEEPSPHEQKPESEENRREPSPQSAAPLAGTGAQQTEGQAAQHADDEGRSPAARAALRLAIEEAQSARGEAPAETEKAQEQRAKPQKPPPRQAPEARPAASPQEPQAAPSMPQRQPLGLAREEPPDPRSLIENLSQQVQELRQQLESRQAQPISGLRQVGLGLRMAMGFVLGLGAVVAAFAAVMGLVGIFYRPALDVLRRVFGTLSGGP